ncbi:MAG: tripartite tricarboxylate transporter TctB family protein [Syntrophales bacterium]
MNVERFLGWGALLLALPVGWASWRYGVGSPNSPGAGFWPLVVTVVTVGLGLALILRPSPDAPAAAGGSRWGKFAVSLGTLALYVLALEPLGYLPATAAMLLVQFRWVEGRTWSSSAFIALSAAVITLILFRVLLKVTLPLGIVPLPRGW